MDDGRSSNRSVGVVSRLSEDGARYDGKKIRMQPGLMVEVTVIRLD